ncbi:MAG: ATP-dependent 6-phosphofructokinase, partial [Thaumarchaeota archaeon]|nr:ATP-dependent 6-phosphofructokinase [Nitrososphaerota archaeon]
FEVWGIEDGYKGLIEGRAKPLRKEDVRDIYAIGGTILGSSRKNPAKSEEDIRAVLDNIRKLGLDGLITIGGDDTLGAARRLYEKGVPVVGVPKTIDNDLSATDYSIGFWTAVQTIAEALERLHTTARSHKRIIVAEIMGRYAGWLALMGGLAGGAHIILIPEKPLDLDEVCRIIEERERRGEHYTLIAVAEGVKIPTTGELAVAEAEKDEYGHVRLGGIAKFLEAELKRRLGKEVRSTILGYVQRGGSPVAFDRVLGIRLGFKAVDLVKEKKFGYAVVLRGTEIVPVKLDEVVGQLRKVPEEFFEYLNVFRG